MSNEIKVVLSDVNKIITKVNWLSSNDYTTAEKTKVANVPNDTNAVLALKANIAQEAWVTPTLLNGWVVDQPISYMKDSLGFVRLKGALKTGVSNTIAFVLPTGFRPVQTTRIPINATGGYGYVSIITTGEVYVVGTTSGGCFVDSVSFRAV